MCFSTPFSIEIALPKHGLYGLIGPNGAGKTTVFNLLTGVYRPNSGSICVDGAHVQGQKPHQIARAGLSRTFQNIRLFGELSVLDNIRLGCQLRRRKGIWATLLRTSGYVAAEQQVRQQAERLLELFNLQSRVNEQAKNLPQPILLNPE